VFSDEEPPPAANDDLLVVVHETSVLVEERGGLPGLPVRARVAPLAAGRVFLGRFADRACYGAAATDAARAAPPAGLRFAPVRSLFAIFAEPTLEIVGRAIAAVEFEAMHAFCGRCAAATEAVPVARERRCPSCGATFHPRIPPAVIVLVGRDDGRVLLARNRHFPAGMFSAVAGFVEIGESLEDAARREVGEEVGVRIGELRYFGSQPWPFGRSLMVGFLARHAGDEIAVDGTEIEEARWFSRDELPVLPPRISIARRLIDAWSRAPGTGPGALL
jgi:NAD+ diphosphatase